MSEEAILKVEHLSKEFYVKSGLAKLPKTVKAVSAVSFSIKKNETYGLVGESGCGKSTTGRLALRLIEPTGGKITFKGQDVSKMSDKPRKTIGSIVEEAMEINHIGRNKKDRMEMSIEMLRKVGIRIDQYYRYPHEFSGGQKQRIGIARALVLNPEIIVCDEPVSALDVSIQSQVLNLLNEIKKEMNVSYLFISHNMSVVRYMADRVGVMYLGQIVEDAPAEELFNNPVHPYTQALLSAVPEADPMVVRERIPLVGDIPSPYNLPDGCKFHNRCVHCFEECEVHVPRRFEVSPGHFVTCHLCDK